MEDQFISELTRFIEAGEDERAYALFREHFFQHPLISSDGDDTELARVCNAIGFDILHSREEWQREVNWWNAVLSTIEAYDRDHDTNLHKGLVYHNRSLPLLELNQPEPAVQSIINAIHEDERNFGEEEKLKRPAYQLGCFLIPIVRMGRWSNGDNQINEDERKVLISCFEALFQSQQRGTDNSSRNVIDGISDEDLKRTLLKRYDSINRNINDDPLLVAIYSGSIMEEILSILLAQDINLSITTFREIANETTAFVYYYMPRLICNTDLQRIVDRHAPLQGDDDTKKRRIRRWSFEQKIDVARRSGLFNTSSNQSMALLSHLLRSYRNLIHPSNLDQMGSNQQWGTTFEISNEIGHMLKTALDLVLSKIQLSQTIAPTTRERHVITPSGTNIPRVYTSLASPGLPGSFDENGQFIPASRQPTPTSTYTSTSSSNPSAPVMGSTTTTLPPEREEGKNG